MASAIVGWRLTVGALPVWWFPVPLLLAWLGVPLAAVDLVARRLPNVLTYAAYPILGAALTVAAAYGPDHSLAVRALVGGALFGAAHLTVRRIAPSALGGGDAKLAGSLGAVLGALGWQALILATALAATITLLLALTPLARRPPTPLAQTPLAHRPPTPFAQTPLAHHPPTPLAQTPLAETPPKEPPVSLAGAAPSAPTVQLAPTVQPTVAQPHPAASHPAEPPMPTHPTEVQTLPTPAVTDPSPPEPIPPTRARPTALLRRAVPHGPGLLVATWLLATFPGQSLIGGVAG
jgi:Flp pilus assembly protein protease CpaA